jgi:hypothetical protein
VTPGGGIGGIDLAPTSVEIGELKPASVPLLDKGKDQIKNYQEGMRLAADLTNQWAKSNGVNDRWRINSTSHLPDSAVKFLPAAWI